jgi:hypothetical protein
VSFLVRTAKDNMCDQCFKLDAFVSTLSHPEIDLTYTIDQVDFQFIRDLHIKHGAINLPDYILTRKPLLDQ